jgi:hypothetical protein
MNLDERGARAATALAQHVHDTIDPASSLRSLYQQTGYRERSRRRRPAALVVGFAAAAVVVVAILIALGVFSSDSSTHPGGKHGQHIPPAGPTAPPPTTAPTTQAAACVQPCLTLHILRADNHQPFPPGGSNSGALVRICPVVSCPDQGSGPGVLFPPADANGDVVVRDLDPALEYDILPMVVNMPGWSCPDYSDPNTGDNYWFPPAPPVTPTAHDVTGTPSALDDTTYFIDDCG